MSQKPEQVKTAPKTKKAAPAQPGKVAEFMQYLRESRLELKKVVWPVRKEVLATTVAVVALVAVMCLYLGLVDFGLTKLMQLILS
ncbi:MAG: preprotein translocase subunit SecE [Desulfovibrionaceae bacterium]|nr:preprotein translocase subunit SecE [Desulfovibrionaceae bacterium]